MKELLLQLFKLTTYQYIVVILTFAIFFTGLISIPNYINMHQGDKKDLKYYLKMLLPIIISLGMATYSWNNIDSTWTQVNNPNIENYQITRQDNIIHFISKNPNLKTQNIDIVSENDTNFYLKYDNKIIEVKKDELKFTN